MEKRKPNQDKSTRLTAKRALDHQEFENLRAEMEEDFVREMIDYHILGSPDEAEQRQTESRLKRSKSAKEYRDHLFNEIIPPAERIDDPASNYAELQSPLRT